MGPVLWQLPANFRRDDELLGAGARGCCRRGRHAFEFRHESWFKREWSMTRASHNAALVIGDHPERAVPDPRADRGLDLHPLALRGTAGGAATTRARELDEVGVSGSRRWSRTRRRYSPTSTTTGRASRPTTPRYLSRRLGDELWRRSSARRRRRDTCICEKPIRSPISRWVRSSTKRSLTTWRSISGSACQVLAHRVAGHDQREGRHPPHQEGPPARLGSTPARDRRVERRWSRR